MNCGIHYAFLFSNTLSYVYSMTAANIKCFLIWQTATSETGYENVFGMTLEHYSERWRRSLFTSHAGASATVNQLIIADMAFLIGCCVTLSQ